MAGDSKVDTRASDEEVRAGMRSLSEALRKAGITSDKQQEELPHKKG